jgi:phosphoribosylformylglycinamidine cyclo-ligase
MTDAYAAAGVDTARADAGVGALVDVLRGITLEGASRSVLPSGHYASVLRVAPNLGIAISTDGVGSKLVVAEQADRLETVGIDCIAMNVNDIVCVGAEPIAMVDYLAVEQADPRRSPASPRACGSGAEDANIEIPAASWRSCPSSSAATRPPTGSTSADAIGTVALDEVITGAEPGRATPCSACRPPGLHSNGFTLARRALLSDGGLALDDTPPSSAAPRWPTCSSRPRSSTCGPSSTCCARASRSTASRT